MGFKFKNSPTEVDGVKFQSKKEARYYQQLCLARRSGDLLFFLRQVPFHLPGGVRYLVDFIEFWKDGKGGIETRFVDVKGMRTPIYILKKKQVEALYPIEILEM
jgi:hypothetical protein